MTQGRFPYLVINEYNRTDWVPMIGEVRIISIQASVSLNNVFLQLWNNTEVPPVGTPHPFAAPMRKSELLQVTFAPPGIVFSQGIVVTLSSDANTYVPIAIPPLDHFHVAIVGHAGSAAYTGEGNLISSPG
jgi:hypothetical protein